MVATYIVKDRHPERRAQHGVEEPALSSSKGPPHLLLPKLPSPPHSRNSPRSLLFRCVRRVRRCFPRSPHQSPGFTLIELMIVMLIIGVLAAIAIPAYTSNVRRAKEAVMREDLQTMRSAIDSFTVDKQKAPQALDDLVQAGYLKVIPIDPITHRNDTWQTVSSDTLSTVDQTDSGGISDIHSGAQFASSDGSLYSTW